MRLGGATLAPPNGALQRRASVCLVIAFWLIWYAAITARSLLQGQPDQWQQTLQRTLICLLAASLCLAVAALITRYRRQAFAVRAALALTLTLPAAAICAGAAGRILGSSPQAGAGPGASLLEALDFIYGWPMFLSWTALFLALVYSFEVREHERRINLRQAAAHRAQLEALHYQINPHFLFNAHNSVLALIAIGESETAERVVECLSTFLRATLQLDPTEEVTLAEELKLQHLYLAVEKIRFSERLMLEIDVEPAARTARVPSLILQPLVENAVRHGVASSLEATLVRIQARRGQGRLVIEIRNSRSGRDPSGCGLGLRNVRDRLAATYGGDAVFEAAEHPDGSFAVEMSLPFRS